MTCSPILRVTEISGSENFCLKSYWGAQMRDFELGKFKDLLLLLTHPLSFIELNHRNSIYKFLQFGYPECYVFLCSKNQRLLGGELILTQTIISIMYEKSESVKSLSCVWLFVTSWTVAHQAPLSMGFSRQEYWSGLLYPPPGDLPDPGIEPRSLLFYCIGRQVLYH